ncbi:MAG: hypothetical protein DI626_02840 [Micavibrio aeruginosavorus]|uniref:Serine aminopeptidase S33 domain-containing protein n=1 Tax=Micavibrio aeruginosavorus TaxID=349221 RepID=A0A2W5C1S9_9BACT|nr:MAG: hypothetical protein DI626_02840 [Micavibrio aeruginosavorus]
MSDDVVDLGSFILQDEPPLAPHLREEPVSFTSRDGATITGFINYPANAPVTQKALFLHEIEGRADGGTMRVLARRYADMGIATLRIDFSGHGDRKAEWENYSPQSMFTDAVSSLDWMDQKWPEVEKSILCGFSTGGAISLMLRAADERVSKCCLLYPVLSFRENFLAAAYADRLLVPINDWDTLTPWRADTFTREKIESSLNDHAPFSLLIHTYGADFIKGCKQIIDSGRDIPALLNASRAPVTVIQGTHDFCVPWVLADMLGEYGRRHDIPLKVITMEGMDHFVPTEWKPSVIKQFKKAAMAEGNNFDSRPVTINVKKEATNLSPPEPQP